MRDAATTQRQGAERGKTVGRGSPDGRPGGRLLVGDYVGLAASEAALAIRRAGLRPGLDRSFGYTADIVGQVVAQKPLTGCDLARNGLVTLYVAAGAVAAPAAEVGELPPTPEQPARVDPARASILPERPSTVPARTRRPRKARRVTAAPHLFEATPAAVPPGAQLPTRARAPEGEQLEGDDWGPATHPETVIAVGGDELQEGNLEGHAGEELPADEFVVYADDLFRGRGGAGSPAWRRGYPRPMGRGVRARLAAHPWLVRGTGAMLAVWAVVGIAAALGGSPGRLPHASVRVGAAGAKVSAIHASDVSAARQAAHGSGGTRPPRSRRGAPSHTAMSAQLPKAAVAPREAVTPATAQPPRGAPNSASPLPAPAQEQSQGGPFSP